MYYFNKKKVLFELKATNVFLKISLASV